MAAFHRLTVYLYASVQGAWFWRATCVCKLIERKAARFQESGSLYFAVLCLPVLSLAKSMLIAYTRFCFKDMHLHQMLALPPFSDCRCTQLTWISALLEMSHCAVSVLMFCYTISIQAFSSQQSYRSKWFQCTTTWFKFFSEIWIKPPSWAILFSRTPIEQVVSTAELPCFSNGLCLHVLHVWTAGKDATGKHQCSLCARIFTQDKRGKKAVLVLFKSSI